MPLVAIGLFLATLQIAGTFSPRELFIGEQGAPKTFDLDFGNYGRFSSLRNPFHRRWDHLTSSHFEKFHSGRFHRLPVSGKRDFEYQLIPSRWVNNGKDPKTKVHSQTSLDNTVSGNPRVSLQIARIPEALQATRPVDGPLRRLTPKGLHIFGDENNSHSSLLAKMESHTDTPKGDNSSGSHSDLYSTKGPKESVLTNNSSKTTFLIPEITSKTTAVERRVEENINVGGITGEIILTDESATENAQEGEFIFLEAKTHKNTIVNDSRNELETDENPTIEAKASEIAIVQEETNENATFYAKTSESTTVEDKRNENIAIAGKTSKITTVTDEIQEVTTDFQLNDSSKASIKNLPTSNPNKSFATVVSGYSTKTETTDSYTVKKTKLSDNNKREDSSTSQNDFSSSTGMLVTSDFTVSTTGKALYSTRTSRASTITMKDAGSSTSMRTEFKSSSGEFAAEEAHAISDHVHDDIPEPVHAIHGHVITISSLKTAKIVISSVFLVSGLIAVAVLAVYWFREKRRAVQYDQLTLLP